MRYVFPDRPTAHTPGTLAFAAWLRTQGRAEGLPDTALAALHAAACAGEVDCYPRIYDGAIVVCRPDVPPGVEPRQSAAEWWRDQQTQEVTP